MALTQADYRAALLQNFRRYRSPVPLGAHLSAKPMSIHVAYRLAKSVTKPLPDDRAVACVREARRTYARAMLSHPDGSPRTFWLKSFQATRIQIIG